MNNLRQIREQTEHQIIGPYGVLSENSKGRRVPEEEDPIRTCFQRDVDRITHSSYPPDSHAGSCSHCENCGQGPAAQ